MGIWATCNRDWVNATARNRVAELAVAGFSSMTTKRTFKAIPARSPCGGTWHVGFEEITMPDPVNSPAHYTSGPIEVIDIIEGFKLGFHLGNVVKYVLRSPLKGAELQDLKKAEWYLKRAIQRLEKQGQP